MNVRVIASFAWFGHNTSSGSEDYPTGYRGPLINQTTTQSYGSQHFLNRQVCQLVKRLPYFMEHSGSLPLSQQPATCPIFSQINQSHPCYVISRSSSPNILFPSGCPAESLQVLWLISDFRRGLNEVFRFLGYYAA